MHKMRKPAPTCVDLLSEFHKYIIDSEKGRRTQKNGTRILKGTLLKVGVTYKTLQDFSKKKKFELRIKILSKNNKRELKSEKFYWQRFYQKFTDYLYNDLNCYDNYVGSVIKDIKAFFNYLANEKNLSVGNFYKQFYVYPERISINTLDQLQLNRIIYDKAFEECLSPTLQKVKDILVVGCTIALRYSDLINLKKANLELLNGQYYLKVQSKKTKVYTRVKLPSYVVEILGKYGKRTNSLLPYYNVGRLNFYLKELAEKAEWTNEVIKTRQKRGIALVIYNNHKKQSHYRFCDHMSSHIMRRTAITTLLSLQMPEHLVKKISGHAPDSREFHKYVAVSQQYLDSETDKIYEKIEGKKHQFLLQN